MRSWFQNKENPTSLSGMWQWRRSRQLLHTIPLQQEVINTMINGFFTARLMDQIKVERDGNSQKVEIYSKKLNKYVKFPEPLVTPNPQPFTDFNQKFLKESHWIKINCMEKVDETRALR